MDNPPADARWVSVPADLLGRWLSGFASRHGKPVVFASPARFFLSAPDGSRAWIDVPFGPAPLKSLEELVVHVATPRNIGVLLVRRGGYAVGIFEESKLIASKTGSSYVQGTTKAGGWSQQRFARRRANQARAAFAEAANAAARVLLPAVGWLDAVVTGGDRGAVSAVLADDRLAPLRPLVQDRWLAVGNPRRRLLVESIGEARAARVAIHP